MTSLRIITNPLKTTYKVGDLLDLGGIRLEYVDERGKISYINASQIQPAEVSGFSTSKVNLNGRMVITKHLLSVVVHYNVEEGRVEPVPPTPPVDPTTIEELLQEILHKMPVSTDTDGVEALLEEIKNKIPKSTDTDDIETLLRELISSGSRDSEKTQSILQQILSKVPEQSDEVEALLQQILEKIPEQSDQIEELLQKIFEKIPARSDQIEILLREIKEKIPEESDQVEALLLQILNRIPESAPQIEALLRELIDKLPTDFENIENILRNILCTIPVESNKVNQQLQEIKEKMPSGFGTVEALLQQILENIPKESNEIEDLLREILQKLPIETSSEVESLLRELITSNQEDSGKVQQIMQQILSKLPEQSGEVEQLLQQILEKIPEESNQVEQLLEEIKAKIPEESDQVERLLEEIKEKIPEQSDQVEQLLQEIKETIPKSTSEELLEIQKVLLKILEKISPEDPTPPTPPTDTEISWQDFKTVLQTYAIDTIKDPGAVLLNLNMLKDWIWNGVIPTNLPSEIQDLVNGKTLSISTVITAVLNGVFKMIASNEEQLHDASFQERATEVLEMLKNLVLGYKFDLATIITFAKKVLHIEQEKRYCAQMGINYEGIEDIGFDVDWILQMLKSVDVNTFKDYFSLDGLRDLISSNILKLDEISEFLPDIASAGIEVADFLKTLIKEGRVDASGITNLLTKKLIDIDWVQENAEKYGINLENIQNLLVNVSKGDFSQITDPELFEKFANDTIPEPYNEYAIVASDLIRYPEDAVKNYGETALNWASSEADVYIQKGTDMLMTTLKGTAVGTFLESTGLDGLVSSGIQTLAITAKNAAMSAVGNLFGIAVNVPAPLPYLQEIVFKVAPEKVVYYIKENFNIDLLEFTAILSNGETKELKSDSFSFSGFDSSLFFEDETIYKTVNMVLKGSVSVFNGFQIPRKLTSSEKQLLKGKKVLRNYFGTIIATDEEASPDTILFPYQVLPLVPQSFEVTTPPNKTSYILGESFDPTGMVGIVTYSDNVSTSKIDVEKGNICISGFDNTKLGTFTAYCCYGEFSSPFEYTIIEGTPRSLILERTPDAPCFYVGDTININGISVKATYSEVVDSKTGEMIPIPLPAQYLTVPTKKFTEKTDSYNVELTYKGFSVNYSVRVVDYSLIFFQVMSTPAKETYIPDEKIVFDGLILAGIQGDTTTIQLNEENDEYVIAFYEPIPERKYLRQYSPKTGKLLSVRQKIVKSGEDPNLDIEKDYATLLRTKEPVRDHDFIVMLSSMISKYPQYASGEPGEYLVYFYTWENIRDPNKKSSSPEGGAWGTLLRTRMTYYLKEEPANFYGYFVSKGEGGTSMKERYIAGDIIDLNGLVIEARYGQLLPDGSYSIAETHVIDKSNFEFAYYYVDDPKTIYNINDPLSLGTSTNRNIKLVGSNPKKPGYEVTHTLLVRNATITGIEVNRQNKKMKYTYKYKEEFDPNILEVYLTYSDGYQEELPLSKCTINSIDTTKVKKMKVIVSYLQYSDSYTISIDKGALQCISIRSEPLKMIYYVNEEFNTKGMEIYGIYDTGYEERISLSDSRLHIVGFYSLRPQANVHVYIDYSGLRAVIHPSVVERDVSYIELYSPPNKVLYQVGEVASWEGLIIRAHMEDGRITQIPLSDLTILGFDSTDPYGEIQIVVEYQGYDQSYSLSFSVFILSGELDHLLIESYPAKRVYGLYEKIDLTGLSVLAVCKSNPTTIELPLSAFTVTGFDSSIITGVDDAGIELERFVYLTISSQSGIQPISYSYKVHNNNLKEIYIVPPICTFIPQSIIQENENGGNTFVSPERLPFKGGSVVEIYEIDDSIVEKKTDLVTILFQDQDVEEVEWKCSCVGTSTTVENTTKVLLTITRYLNGIPVKEASMEYSILISMGTWYNSFENKETPNICFVGEKPTCAYVHWTFTYWDYIYKDGQWKWEKADGDAFATTEGIDQNVITFSEIGVTFSYPDTSYAHKEKMSFISPIADENMIKTVNYYYVEIIDTSSKPKCIDILTLPNKLEYNLDDQIIDLTGIELVQVYQDQTTFSIDTDDLEVLSFDTSSEGQHKVLFSALDGQIRLVYDIDVKAVPNALFINCLPNQTIYYNNTYTSPSLEGLEVQAQFKDLDSGYVWHQDIENEELEIKTFDTSKPKTGERIINGAVNRLCAVMWRGAQTFFEYTVLVGDPIDTSIDLDEGGYILKKQKRIDHSNPRIYLEDVIVHYIYPDKSQENILLSEVLSSFEITILSLQIQQIQFEEGALEQEFVYSISILNKEYLLHYIVVKGGVFAITAFDDKTGNIINYLEVSNSLAYNFNFNILLHYSNGMIEEFSIEDTNLFEVKEEFLKVGTRELYKGCIIYIKDGYYVPYDEDYVLPNVLDFVYNGFKIKGIKNVETDEIYGYIYGVDMNSPPELENNTGLVIPTENIKYNNK